MPLQVPCRKFCILPKIMKNPAAKSCKYFHTRWHRRALHDVYMLLAQRLRIVARAEILAAPLLLVLGIIKQPCSLLLPQCEDGEWVTPVFRCSVIREQGKQKADNLFCTSVRGLYLLPALLRTQWLLLHLPTCEMQWGQFQIFKTEICMSTMRYTTHVFKGVLLGLKLNFISENSNLGPQSPVLPSPNRKCLLISVMIWLLKPFSWSCEEIRNILLHARSHSVQCSFCIL